jgi:hypothetical protein
MKMAVLWVVVPCGLVEFNNVSKVCTAATIIALMVEAARTSQNVGELTPVYTALQPIRQPSS